MQDIGDKQTIEQFLQTYLKKRYGLKQLVIDHARGIVKSIAAHKETDCEIMLFSKILKNEVEEGFRDN